PSRSTSTPGSSPEPPGAGPVTPSLPSVTSLAPATFGRCLGDFSYGACAEFGQITRHNARCLGRVARHRPRRPRSPRGEEAPGARRLIDLDTHREVFGWVLGVLADRGLLKGQRIAID